MRRRIFISLLGSAAITWPCSARAQQAERIRRIGVLMPLAENDQEAQVRVAAFRAALQKLGWTDGRNVRINIRWAAGDPDLLRAYATELVGMTQDVLLVSGSSAAVALQQTSRTAPIVFVQVGDPVGAGLVASLARPGGNITGFATYEQAIGVKWLELLKEMAPRVSRVAVVYDPANPGGSLYLREIETAAPSFGVQLSPSSVRAAAEIERAISTFAGQPNGGLIVVPAPTTNSYRGLIIALAARYRLPAVYPYRFYVTDGGLASYGFENIDLWRRAASYVDRILKGEKPADLPVQQANKFELVLNLKTAKALGLDVLPKLRARADEVIE
jgi:putative tryptophan/tyrosine transport system substrate-binding protein